MHLLDKNVRDNNCTLNKAHERNNMCSLIRAQEVKAQCSRSFHRWTCEASFDVDAERALRQV